MADVEKKSFVMYDSWATLLCNLPAEEAGKLIQTICRYRLGDEVDIEDPVMHAMFQMIKTTLDADAEKYAATCERRKTSGSKGGEANASKSKQKAAIATGEKQKEANASKSKQKAAIANEYDSEYDSESEYKEIYTASASVPADAPDKKTKKKSEPKHKHGEYQHVLLTDAEMEKLKTDYGEQNALDAVQYLDEYIERKGYKANSHYLTLRKWVFDALDEERQRKRRAGPAENQNSSGRSAPKNREYDYTALEKDLIARGLPGG